MSCPACTINECINLYVNPCDTGINTGIVLTESGNYTVRIEFNGAFKTSVIAVVADEPIVLPNTLNSSYLHVMTIFDSDGELVNDTCYKLNMHMTLGMGNNITPNPEAGANKLIIVDVDGQEYTDAFFALHEIQAISTENQTYLRDVGFTQSGATITAISFGFFNGQTIFAQA